MSKTLKEIINQKRSLIITFLVVIGILFASAAGYLAVTKLRSTTTGQPTETAPGVTTMQPSGLTKGNLVSASSSESQASTAPISIQLSEGQAQPQAVRPLTPSAGEPLSDQAIQDILARLPDLAVEPQDQVEFRLAQSPIPPPRPGSTLPQGFPPTEKPLEPETVTTGPLQVLRYAPEGELKIAPFISITFNQPMVPLATLQDLSAAQVPAIIEPSLPGTWRWVGTRTLTFQYASEQIDRLPKATDYRVTIPAGVKSATGNALAEAVVWSFSTPPPAITWSYPDQSPQPLDPIFISHFDQNIDAVAVLKTIRGTAAGKSFALQQLTESDLKTLPKSSTFDSKHIANLMAGHWVAFRAASPLPADTEITVTVGPGTPSAEGPRLTETAQTYTFRTYARLRVESHDCHRADQTLCLPLTPFYISFNNPLDVTTFKESQVRVKPELPGASVDVQYTTLIIRGAPLSQTKYTITLSGDLRDVYGQVLGEDTEVSFQIGTAEARLYGPEQAFITLDPAAKKPVLSVYDLNYPRLDTRIYAVQPSDWHDFQYAFSQYRSSNEKLSLPGQLVQYKTITVEAAADTLTQVDIDLSQFIKGQFGHFIVVVAPPKELLKDERNLNWQTVIVWVQITHIGLDAFNDGSQMIAWTTSLKDGAPLAGVAISSDQALPDVVTGADGLTSFSFPNGFSYLTATLGDDTALLPSSPYGWETVWINEPRVDDLRWYVFDDRKIYRPGEQIHAKGWIRRIGSKPDGDVSLVGPELSSIRYQIVGPQGNELGNGQLAVNALGGFDLAFTIPENVNLGYSQLILDAEGALGAITSQRYIHGFQILEFRRPEFEVTARNETSGPYFAGGQATLAVEAKYYAGGPLPNAEVKWQVTSSPGTYSPPNWPDFTFGSWTPWWFYNKSYPGYRETTNIESFTGQTDASGTHYLRLNFSSSEQAQPLSVQAEATVMDVNRQAWTGSTTLLVHPADLYIGLRSATYFVERGKPLKIDFIVTDLDGNPVPDRPVELRAARLEWKYKDGDWQEIEVDVQQCSLGSQKEPVTCTFQTPVGGSYKITAVVTDSNARKNQSQITRWVTGGQRPPSRKVEQEQVTLIPDKESYQPGEVAKILVQAPFTPAEGLLTVTRSGILYTERFQVKDGTATLEIPIKDAHIPNLNLQVDLAGSAPRLDDQGNPLSQVDPRPAYATGELTLPIPPLTRSLTVTALPEQKELSPGSETTINVTVTDAKGHPVPGAELAVVVVDEAILALSNYQLADPLAVFYPERSVHLNSIYSRANLILLDPQALAAQAGSATTVEVSKEVMVQSTMVAPMAALEAPSIRDSAGAQGNQAEPINVRSDFNPLAAFAPSVSTGSDGTAQVGIKLPDNLTRYRVMVVAVDENRQFGKAESNLVARLPLMVRPSAPRFLNFGDRFELPIVLQNQTDQPLETNVVLRTTNLTLLPSATVNIENPTVNGVRVTIPPRDRIEIRFPATTQTAGTARIQVAAVSGAFSDSAAIELPVYTPATTEAFATYGVLDEGSVAQPLLAPTDVYPQFGALEIQTSSTALQTLADAVLYLVSYPYECTEQLASRVLAVAALRDVLTAFKTEGLPSPEAMQSAVERDLQRLQGLQNEDGGFPYWQRGKESIPFNTIHVAHAVQRAKEKGFPVPAEMQPRLLEYLRNIENHYPDWYGPRTRQALSAYALYVRKLMDDADPDKALRLLNDADLENLSLESIGWLWQVLQDAPQASAQLSAIRKLVNNRVVETAGAANFTTAYDEQTYLLLSSDRRTDAILLEALMVDDPKSDLIPKVVNGLLAHRTKGRWNNTQENVFILLALDRYFNTYEAQTPDFIARLWLGEEYAGDHTFQGRSTDRLETSIPMDYLMNQNPGSGKTQDLIISKEGVGRLYYRLGLRYAPTNLKQAALDMGFVVQRRYEAVDDPADVTRDETGVWQIKAGARVQVRLTMVADTRRYHVALADPLPAGLEILNPALAVSESQPATINVQPSTHWYWWWTWFEHQNLRDERAEAFTSLLWEGTYEYTYVARATTPGTFIVPPAKAEEMYSPEVFGRSASDVVIVK